MLVFNNPYQILYEEGHAFFIQEFPDKYGATFAREDWNFQVTITPKQPKLEKGDMVRIANSEIMFEVVAATEEYVWARSTATTWPPSLAGHIYSRDIVTPA